MKKDVTLAHILATIIVIYIIFAVILAPLGAGYPQIGLLSVFVDNNLSFSPFLYGLVLSLVLYLPLFYLMAKIFGTKATSSILSVYIFLALTSFSIYMLSVASTEARGYILYFGFMLYPTKYTFISIVITLVTIFKINKFEVTSWKIVGIYRKYIFVIVMLYLILTTLLPFSLRIYGYSFLERGYDFAHPHSMAYDCKYDDAMENKKCVDKMLLIRNKSVGHIVDNFLYRLQNPHKKFRYSFSNGNFKDKHIEKIDSFITVKECFYKDICVMGSNFSKYDIYKDIKSSIWKKAESVDRLKLFGNKNGKSIIFGFKKDNNNYLDLNLIIKKYDTGILTNDKDVIITTRDNQYEMYFASAEYINLTNNKGLVVVSVSKFIFDSINEYKEEKYTLDGGYYAYINCDIKNCDKSLDISVNKRDNPEVIYIKYGEDVFSFDM